MTSIRSVSVVATAAFALIATSATSAGVMDITYSGIASGTWLNGLYSGQSFSGKAFSFHFSYLTDAITTYSQGYNVDSGAADVTVEGYGNFAVTSSTGNFAANVQSRAGFYVTGQGDVLSFGNGALSSWDMQSNIGPITGTGVFNTQNVFTTAGAIRFSGSTTVTFTATAVPAPGAVALVGLAGLAGSRRRRA